MKRTAAEMCLKIINERVFMLDDEIHKCSEGSAHNCSELDIPYEIFLLSTKQLFCIHLEAVVSDLLME